ncbi:MAG TPA: hypothetical protein VIL82_02105 [Solirubrobacteraceae bacterium]
MAVLPTATVGLETSTELVVESFRIVRLTGELPEPETDEPGDGVNTAVSCSGELAAVNLAGQVTVTLWPKLFAGTEPQPGTVAPRFANATAPVGGAPLSADVIVAMSVTSWFVVALLGEARMEVVLAAVDGDGEGDGDGNGDGGSAAATGEDPVAASGPWLAPLGSVSLTATAITWPTSLEVRPYCCPPAFEMGTQLVPLAVQRLQL